MFHMKHMPPDNMPECLENEQFFSGYYGVFGKWFWDEFWV